MCDKMVTRSKRPKEMCKIHNTAHAIQEHATVATANSLETAGDLCFFVLDGWWISWSCSDDVCLDSGESDVLSRFCLGGGELSDEDEDDAKDIFSYVSVSNGSSIVAKAKSLCLAVVCLLLLVIPYVVCVGRYQQQVKV